MNALAKNVWLALLVIFFVGSNIVWYLLVGVVIFLLVLWLNPEWLDKM